MRSWSRPTSPRAVSMCGTFRTSLTMICRRRSTPICIALAAPAVPPEPGWPSPSSPTTTRPWCPRLNVCSARPGNDGRCTASSMPRPGPRTRPTVAVCHAAGSHSVIRPPQRSSGPRQGPTHGKNPQVPHPRCPCQAGRREDRTTRRVDAGNQQWQGVIGGESASRHGGRCIGPAGAGRGRTSLRGGTTPAMLWLKTPCAPVAIVHVRAETTEVY